MMTRCPRPIEIGRKSISLFLVRAGPNGRIDGYWSMVTNFAKNINLILSTFTLVVKMTGGSSPFIQLRVRLLRRTSECSSMVSRRSTRTTHTVRVRAAHICDNTKFESWSHWLNFNLTGSLWGYSAMRRQLFFCFYWIKQTESGAVSGVDSRECARATKCARSANCPSMKITGFFYFITFIFLPFLLDGQRLRRLPPLYWLSVCVSLSLSQFTIIIID